MSVNITETEIENGKEEIPEDESSKKKNQLKNILRLGISLIAFVCLLKFGKVDLSVAVKYLLKVNPAYFTLAFLSYLSTMFISGMRSQAACRPLGFNKKYYQFVQLNFIGTFFNNFLPTTFGGDAVRGYYLKRGSNLSIKKAIACIFYERYTGMIILFWGSSIAFLMQDFGLWGKEWQVPSQLALFSHLATLVSILFVPFLPKINKLIFGNKNWIYSKFIEPFLIYWEDKKLTIKILFLSVLLQVGVITCHIFIAKSLSLQIPLSYYLIFYPLTTIAGFLIPSLNGLGVREGAYIYFLKKVNIGSEQALAFSICWLIVLLMTSVIGGVIYMVGDFRKNHKH
jgi:uncharacterized protein (TIRG00374 family)